MATSSVHAKLVAVTGPAVGEVFALTAAEVTVGRDVANTIYLPDPGLSRRHCAFVADDEGWEVRDLGSSNGTFVNGVHRSSHRLADGDHVGLGHTMLVFTSGARASAKPSAAAGERPAEGPTLAVALDELPLLRPAPGGPTSRVEHGLRALLSVSTMLQTADTEADVHQVVLEAVRDVTGDTTAALVRMHGGDVERVASLDTNGGSGALFRTSLLQQALERRSGALANDGRDAGTAPHAKTDASALCAPIVRHDGEPLFIYASRHAGPLFDDEDVALLTAIGRITALALEHVARTQALRRQAERLHADLALEHSLVGESAPMQRVYERITRVARSTTTVLITGETGTGKELAARAIHLNGPRARQPFVAINCAALTETLLESELFGYERGAFTGAVTQKKGRIELADRGTLFLDEVGELAPSLQSKLLRVLQQQEVERLGSTRSVRVDVRVIAATNARLQQEIAAGRFRSDLYFRLNVVTVEMPPLRERRSDIPVLARHFLARLSGKGGRRLTGFSLPAMAALEAYAWPGNVRELENVVERAVVLGTTSEILPDDLPEELLTTSAAASETSGDLDYHRAVLAAKKRVIQDAFRRAGGSYVETARLLHVHPNYLHRLVRTLELKPMLDPQV